MVFITNVSLESESASFRLYANSDPVGPGRMNRPIDCNLVQHLFQLIGHEKTLKGYVIKPAFAEDGLKSITQVTGTRGPITSAWIKNFQKHVKRTGKSIRVDDYIDPPRFGQAASTISKTVYTMVWLNFALIKINPERHAEIPTHPDTPTDLKDRLSALLINED